MARWHEFGYYPPSRPREAKGGIKAQSKRGAFASSWWGQRWIATLESFPIGARLGRGRSYARKGQVISLEIDKGRVTAEVQGSRTRPYAVSITMKPIATSKWRKIAKQAVRKEPHACGGQVHHGRGDAAGDGEEVFADAARTLVPDEPEGPGDQVLVATDWSNPCKHVAAVYYLLRQRRSTGDPFLLFRLNGAWSGTLSRRAARAGRGTTGDEADTGPGREPKLAPAEPLTDPILTAFWSGPIRL